MKLNPKSSIVVLTGAGISAESGIKTFRDHNGLWENHRVEDVASPEGFRRDPELVQQFYNLRRAQLLDPAVQPNAAHLALARLEKEWDGDFLLITQNVDDLHDRASSKNIIHMHGELLKVSCSLTGQIMACKTNIDPETRCPCCDRTGTLRPHIVWFGEMPLEMDTIERHLDRCDLFVSIGASGQVYPAAGFVQMLPSAAYTLEINRESTAIGTLFQEKRTGLAGELVPKWVDEFLNSIRIKI